MCIFKQQPQKSHEKDILPRYLQIDRSFFTFYGTQAINYFMSYGDFYASRTQDAEVTKSLTGSVKRIYRLILGFQGCQKVLK